LTVNTDFILDEAQTQNYLFAKELLIVGQMCYTEATETHKWFFETLILRSVPLTPLEAKINGR